MTTINESHFQQAQFALAAYSSLTQAMNLQGYLSALRNSRGKGSGL